MTISIKSFLLSPTCSLLSVIQLEPDLPHVCFFSLSFLFHIVFCCCVVRCLFFAPKNNPSKKKITSTHITSSLLDKSQPTTTKKIHHLDIHTQPPTSVFLRSVLWSVCPDTQMPYLQLPDGASIIVQKDAKGTITHANKGVRRMIVVNDPSAIQQGTQR